MNRIIPFLVLVGFSVVSPVTSQAASGTFSGRIWNDMDRDGIQDAGEPAMSNFPITVYNDIILWMCGCPGFICPLATFYTDADGYYDFTFSSTNEICPDAWDGTNKGFYVIFDNQCITYGHSPENAGDDDEIDSDFSYCGVVVTGEGFDFTNMDLGLYRWRTGLSLELTVSGAPAGSPYYVTNGATVTYTYRVANTGEVYLSFLGVIDDADYDFFGSVDCPMNVAPQQTLQFHSERTMHSSVTNLGAAWAIPVDPGRCEIMYSYDPVFDEQPFVVIVVTNPLAHVDGDVFPNAWEIQYGFDPLNSNAPNVNSDSDWMTNYEEYLAGTDPTNHASFFPNAGITEGFSLVVTPSVTNRVYNIWRSTNLLGEPQEWLLYPPEQTGTGAAVLFTIPADDPTAQFRTGVRLP